MAIKIETLVALSRYAVGMTTNASKQETGHTITIADTVNGDKLFRIADENLAWAEFERLHKFLGRETKNNGIICAIRIGKFEGDDHIIIQETEF